MPLTDDVVVRRKIGVQAAATAARRRIILDAAVIAFSEAGYNATSMRDIASRAGLSHTGLLHHFPEKALLLEAALDDRFAVTDEEFDFGSANGEVVMRALVGAAERDVADPVPLRFLAVVTAESIIPTHPAYGLMRNLQLAVRTRLTEAFEDLRARGLYLADPLPPEAAAVHVASLRNGAIAEWLRAPEELDLVETVKQQLRMFTSVDL